MEPKEQDIEFPRGDTCPISFEITDAEKNPLDMSDAEIYFTVKKNYNTSDIIFQKRLSKGEITVEDILGSLVVEHKDTAELKYGNYVYDIQFKSGDYVKTLAKGNISLTDESTHISNE